MELDHVLRSRQDRGDDLLRGRRFGHQGEAPSM